jgi:phosphoribosylanthranilate isomerase
MMKRPYVSLSALSGPDDVKDIQRGTSALALPASHDLLLGISADRGTAAGQSPAAPRKLADIRALRDIADALDGSAALAVHFECYYRNQEIGALTGDVFDFARQRTAPFADDVLKTLDGVPAELLGAVQLNGVIDPDELRKLHERRPDVPVIYQLRRELADRGDRDVVAHLQACRFAVSHVLLDLSAGRGVPLRDEERSRLADIVRSTVPEARMGIAGGISADNVGAMYHGAFEQLGHVSVDTETAIREPGTDAFSPKLSLEFLRRAYEAIRRAGA